MQARDPECHTNNSGIGNRVTMSGSKFTACVGSSAVWAAPGLSHRQTLQDRTAVLTSLRRSSYLVRKSDKMFPFASLFIPFPERERDQKL